MIQFFQKLKISQKLGMISVFFMIPDMVLLCLFLMSINANIRFAQWERHGNEYQRPLEELLEALPRHAALARRSAAGTGNAARELAVVQARIDQGLSALEEVDTRLGDKLQFDDEGLAKRNRDHCRVSNLTSEWQKLKASLATLSPAASEEQHLHLVSDVRTMITHAGDNSNLILDPDLDSYYLMDVTLLALPQMQDRLAKVMSFGEEVLSKGPISSQDRRQLAVHAAFLKSSDLDRVVDSAQTALNEDANFYGRNDSLHAQLPSALHGFKTATEEFIRVITALSEEEHPEVHLAQYLEAGSKAHSASFVLWRSAVTELDALIDKRISYYQTRRARSLILTALALGAAISFVTFITRSISHPLQRHAAELGESNRALQAQIVERGRVEAALRAAEEKYRGIFENAVEGIFQTSPEGNYLVANPTLARMYGYDSVADLQSSITDVGRKLYVDSARRMEFRQQMENFGEVRRFESEIYRKDGSVIWISEHARAVRDDAGRLLYYEGTVENITERKQQETELGKVHQELVQASRLAGMAEVATGVLHNVGNVLNSVNVSANFVAERIRKSKVADLPKIAGLLREHSTDLDRFITADPKGKQLPGYIIQLADHLTGEQATLLKRTDLLREQLEHVKEIVAMQQTYAKVSGVSEPINLADLVEDALRLNAGSLTRHEVSVLREFEATPTVSVDKHKILQILVNLIGNAKHACVDSGRADKTIVIRTFCTDASVGIAVADNGVGIAPENLIRIFNHGFTTRKEGHGFGLHSGALAAKELGGSLQVRSDGVGQGASFTIELPLKLLKAA